MRVAIYARVSTKDQDCESQVAALEEYCRKHDHTVVGVYKDTISGVRSARPGRDLLMGDALKERFDLVICTKLDRWGRSSQDIAATVDRLSQIGVQWQAVDSGFSAGSDAIGRLTFLVMAAYAEFERELIRERTKASLDYLKESRGYIKPPKVWDRKAAWEDRVAGMPFVKLERKYKVGRHALIAGWVRYAEENNLDTTTVLGRPEGWRKKGGKQPIPTTCRICGITYPTQLKERRCCVAEKKRRNGEIVGNLRRGQSAFSLPVREAMLADRLAGVQWLEIVRRHGASLTTTQRCVSELAKERGLTLPKIPGGRHRAA